MDGTPCHILVAGRINDAYYQMAASIAGVRIRVLAVPINYHY
jgi:hypothetical protein